jgi:hypothetical protein
VVGEVNAGAAMEARATTTDVDTATDVTAEVHVTGLCRATDAECGGDREYAEEL